MNNKKGFTLIELLAVIVILAIIALISTPIILGVIDDARLNSARDAAYGLADAVRLQYVEQMYSDAGNTAVSYSGDITSIKVSGTQPDTGTWSIDNEGSVILTNIVFGEYTCNTGTDAVITCSRTPH